MLRTGYGRLDTVRITSEYLLPKLKKLSNLIMKLRLVASFIPSWIKLVKDRKSKTLSHPRKEGMSYHEIIEYLEVPLQDLFKF